MLRATGFTMPIPTGQSPGSLIDMTGVDLVINIPDMAIGSRNRGAMADNANFLNLPPGSPGGTVILTGATVSLGSTTGPRSRALEADDPGSTLSATNTNVNIKDFDIGAYAFGGAKLTLSGKSTVTLTGSNSFGIVTEDQGLRRT
jgi:hypothetical protein